MTQTGYIETYNGYDIYCDGPGAWYAAPEFPGAATGDDDALVTWDSRTALRRAIDATYDAPGGAS